MICDFDLNQAPPERQLIFVVMVNIFLFVFLEMTKLRLLHETLLSCLIFLDSFINTLSYSTMLVP